MENNKQQLEKQVDQIAQVCHEANRAYCVTIGDTTQLPWNDAPTWQKDSARNGVRFHLATLDSGNTPDPKASHENWLKVKETAGWRYGTTKDETLKTHPAFLPYEQLPVAQRLKDYIFCSIVEGFYQGTAIETRRGKQQKESAA